MRQLLIESFSELGVAPVESLALPGTEAYAIRMSVRPDAKRQVLLSGHYDTVYGATHPFQTCSFVSDDLLRGPGVADMKGGIVVMLEAVRKLERSSAGKSLGYEIILTPDEETGSKASRGLLQSIAQSKRHDIALVFEPARPNGDVVQSRKGIGKFTITVHGRAAHAGRDPESGRSAILALAAIVQQIDAIPSDVPDLLINIGTIRGGGVVNVVPDLASADLDVRVDSLEEVEIFRERVLAILSEVPARFECHAELTGGLNRPPKIVTPLVESLFQSWQECGRDVGVELSCQHVGGGSDGNLLFAAGLDSLDGLGPVGDHLHSDRECCLVSSVDERAAIASLFLHRVADGTIALAGSSWLRK